MGTAEGKNSEQRWRLYQDPGHGKGSQPQLYSWASRLRSQPQPRFMQAYLCVSSQPGGLRVTPRNSSLREVAQVTLGRPAGTDH